MEYYDATKLSAFASCPRKYFWRYVEKIEPISIPLWKPWGRAIHRGLESLYTAHDINLAVAAFDTTWAEESLGEEEKGHTGEGGVNLLRAYHGHYFPEPYRRNTETEIKLMATLGEGIQYLGYLDLVARSLFDGGLVLLDHKTSARRPSNEDTHSDPLTGYVWLVKQVREEQPQAFLNYLINTKVPQFIRQPLSEGGEEQWKENVVAQVRAIRGMHSLEDFYQARGSCSYYGKCEFSDLCDAPKGQRLKLITEHYRPKKGRKDGQETD